MYFGDLSIHQQHQLLHQNSIGKLISDFLHTHSQFLFNADFYSGVTSRCAPDENF